MVSECKKYYKNFMLLYFCTGSKEQSRSDQHLVLTLYSRNTLNPVMTCCHHHVRAFWFRVTASINIHEYQINSCCRCAVINDGYAGLWQTSDPFRTASSSNGPPAVPHTQGTVAVVYFFRHIFVVVCIWESRT